MNVRTFIIIITFSFIFSGCELINNESIIDNFKSENENTQKKETLVVDYVIDGDTFISHDKKYRLILVDTPESKHRNMDVQPYSLEASKYTREQLEGQTVEVEYGIKDIDKYGRYLVYVWKNEELFNEKLVENGYARVLSIPPNTKYLDQIKEKEQIAKNEKRGLWSLTDC